MVNKAVVGVIGVVLITTLGVGALVGLQGGGGPADDATPDDGSNDDDGATAATTPNGTTGNGTSQSPNATATDDSDGAEIALTRSEFTVAELEANLTAGLDAWRAREDLAALKTGPGTTKEALKAMAREHSSRMAAAGMVGHEIENDTTRKRYRAHDLYYTCQFTGSDGNNVYRPGAPDRMQFEWVARDEVDTSFSRDQGILFHENESTVATNILDQWRGDDALQYGLLSSNYEKAGVGINVTRDGTAYATIHLCGK